MTIFTIGHSNHKIDEFLSLLEEFNIILLVDIRSIPYSKYQSEYNYDSIRNIILNNKFEYRYLGDKIGGKYEKKELQFYDGGIDYSKVASLNQFINGIDELIILNREYPNLVLMCVEKDPYYCHRFALISHALLKRNIITEHILPLDNRVISNKDLVQKMREDYGEKNNIDELFYLHNRIIFHKEDLKKITNVNESLFSEKFSKQNFQSLQIEPIFKSSSEPKNNKSSSQKLKRKNLNDEQCTWSKFNQEL